MLYRFRLTIIFAIMFCLASGPVSCAKASQMAEPVSMERNRLWAAPMQVKGLPNLFQVTPDLYRSAQPDETGMANAKKMGIKTVLSLRSSNKDPSLSAGTGLTLRRVPLATWDISDEEIIAALSIIHSSPKPVLVHCLHGADRTGLIIAMYRMVFQDWSKEKAKDELLHGNYGFHGIWTNIPKKIDDTDIAAIKAEVMKALPAEMR